MPNKNNRITKSKEIQIVLKFGKKYDGNFVNIYSQRIETPIPEIMSRYDKDGKFIESAEGMIDSKPSELFARFNVIISAKFGLAHERNLFKRRVRNILRQNQAALKQQNVIVVAKTNISTLSYKDLYNELDRILFKHGK